MVAGISEGWRIFLASQQRKKKGIRRYGGSSDDICRKVVEDCYNGTFFQVSNGNFPQFYTRDFGWCVDALLKLGYRREVESTLQYAVEKFAAANKITAAITPKGKPFDFPGYAVDSLPMLLRLLHAAKMRGLVKEHRDFLEGEIGKFAATAVAEDGLIRRDKYFASMKDHAMRTSSCYDNCMAGMLEKTLRQLPLSNPLRQYTYRKLIEQQFWTGEYFRDDLSGSSYVSGDANIFPFWSGVFTEKGMMRAAFAAITAAGLDKPFPLRYTTAAAPVRWQWFSFFAPDYQKDAVWNHMGLLFMQLMKKIDRERYNRYREEYSRIIGRYGNIMEVYFPDGKPYRSPFYCSDEGMLWAANLLV